MLQLKFEVTLMRRGELLPHAGSADVWFDDEMRALQEIEIFIPFVCKPVEFDSFRATVNGFHSFFDVEPAPRWDCDGFIVTFAKGFRVHVVLAG